MPVLSLALSPEQASAQVPPAEHYLQLFPQVFSPGHPVLAAPLPLVTSTFPGNPTP